MQPVVITGMGIITSCGAGKDNFFSTSDKFCAEAGEISLFSTDNTNCRYAHEIMNLDETDGLPRKGLRTMDRNTKIAIAATSQAINEAELSDSQIEQAGLILGSEFGSLSSIGKFDRGVQSSGLRGVTPMEFQNTVLNAPASRVNITLGIKGLSTTIACSQTASIDSVGYASQFVEDGQLKTALAGGSEELSEEWFYAMDNDGKLSKAKQAYPFYTGKNGFHLGEGAAMFVIESAQRSRERNVAELAQIIGYANGFATGTDEAYTISAGNVIYTCLSRAGISPEDIDLVYCNANGDNDFDRMISQILSAIFNLRNTQVSSLKGVVGECMGACGALSIAAILAGFQGYANGGRQRPSDLDPSAFCTPISDKKPKAIRYGMALSVSAYGNAAAIILKNPMVSTC